MKFLFPLIVIPALMTAALCAEPAVPNSLRVSARSQTGAISVTVTDESGAPVPDAAVAVRLPEDGETGTFADGTHAAVAYTDQQGEARVAVRAWSTESGAVLVKITATKGSARAGMLFEQKLGHEETPRSAESSNTATAKKAPLISAKEQEGPVVQPGHLQNAPAVAPARNRTPGTAANRAHGDGHARADTGTSKQRQP